MTIQVTHANLKTPIVVVTAQLFGLYYSESLRATILISSGSTTIPVLESLDEIKALLQKGGLSQPNQVSQPILSTAPGLQPDPSLPKAAEASKG